MTDQKRSNHPALPVSDACLGGRGCSFDDPTVGSPIDKSCLRSPVDGRSVTRTVLTTSPVDSSSYRCQKDSLPNQGGEHTTELRSMVATWYEIPNCAIGPEGVTKLSQVDTVVSGEHGVLEHQSLDCVINLVATQDVLYNKYRRSLSSYQSRLFAYETTMKGERPREPKAVGSPDALLAEAGGKALQVVEMYCLWTLTQRTAGPKVGSANLFRLWQMLLGLYLLGYAEAYLKIKLATLDAISKKQTELPTVKAPFRERAIRSRRFFPGSRGLINGSWILRCPDRSQSFVFWMKRGAPRVSAVLIRAQEESSFEILTSPLKVPDVIQVDTPTGAQDVTSLSLREEVRRTVREVFLERNGGLKREWSSTPTFQLPSNHAHFEFSRKNGGARARLGAFAPSASDLLRLLSQHSGLENNVWSYNRISQHVNGHSFIQRSCSSTCLHQSNIPFTSLEGKGFRDSRAYSDCREYELDDRYGRVLRRMGFVPRSEERNNCKSVLSPEELVVLQWQYRDFPSHHIFEKYEGGFVDEDGCPLIMSQVWAKVIGLAEPLKVRTITAGSEEAYYWALYIQKLIHGIVRHHPVFRLIGAPLTLQDILTSFSDPLRPGEFFVSGDYKSATDLISSDLSEVCAREIANCVAMPAHVEELFVNCLTRHRVVLGKGQNSLRGDQENGQLMGSPVSFPILCLINASLTRYSKELGLGRKLRLTEMALLINGDDVGFVSDSTTYEIWKKVTALGGLQFSVGKNFTSPEFLVLNSCFFRLGPLVRPRPMRECVRRTPHPVPLPNLLPTSILSSRFTPAPVRLSDRNPPSVYTQILVPWAQYVPKQLASWRNSFFVTSWHNPDFLGPRGRYTLPGQDLSSLPAFDRLRVRSISEAIMKEDSDGEFSVLPSLQKAWLVDTSGDHRHRLNLTFLNSWRPVLDLFRTPQAMRGKLKCGLALAGADWFTPTSLGGLGLENTHTCCGHGPGKNGRKIAMFLSQRPDIALKALSISPQLPSEVSLLKEMIERPVLLQRKGTDVPRGMVGFSDYMSYAGYRSYSRTFGKEWEDSMNGEDVEGAPYFRRQWDRVKDPERTSEDFIEMAKRFWANRSILYKHHHVNKWIRMPGMSDRQLQSFVPFRRFYELELPSPPKVDLSSFDPSHPPALLELFRVPRASPLAYGEVLCVEGVEPSVSAPDST